MKLFLMGFVFAALVSTTATAVYLGYFKSVELIEGQSQKLDLVLIKHRGAYHLINPLIEKVEAWAEQNNVSCSKTIGIFLDDPREVMESDLRSRVGCVVSNFDPNLQLAEGLIFETRDSQKSLIAKFSGSPALGPLKVYPEVTQWFQEMQYRLKLSIEIYEMNKDGKFNTTYIFPITD